MKSADRLNKFLDRINELITTLTKERDTLLQQGVDRYYYIQKREELKLLQEGIADTQKRIADEKDRLNLLNEKLEESYKDLFNAWRKDTRWINTVMKDRQPKVNSDRNTPDLE